MSCVSYSEWVGLGPQAHMPVISPPPPHLTPRKLYNGPPSLFPIYIIYLLYSACCSKNMQEKKSVNCQNTKKLRSGSVQIRINFS